MMQNSSNNLNNTEKTPKGLRLRVEELPGNFPQLGDRDVRHTADQLLQVRSGY